MNAGDLVGGKYRLTQRLGAGSMGTVWAAINERTRRKVALKLILHPTDDLRYRLLREARACGSLEHRNIVEIYDVGETAGGDPFLVMQLLSGETLADLLSRRRTIEPVLVAAIGRDIASALAAAHDASIVHRDLKPANIFLYREGSHGDEDAFVLKVLDFGVSKNLAIGDGRATATGMMVGSPAYMSPEQIRMAKDVDHRTDIWSLGVTLFELLTGTRPFQGVSEEMIRQILTAPIPTVSSRLRHVPPELDAVVTRCLSRNRDERYHDTKELARTLAALAGAIQPARRIVNVPSGRGSDAATEVSGPFAGSAATALSQERETAETSAKSEGAAEAPHQQDPRMSASPTGTQLLSPTAPIPSPMPAWRREVQQALAASRQVPPPPPRGGLSEAPAAGAPPEAPSEIDARIAGKAGPETPPATQDRLPEARSARVTAKAPNWHGSRRLYAGLAVGVLAVTTLAVGLTTRRAPPPTVAPLATSEPMEAPVPSTEPPVTAAPPNTPPPPESTVAQLVTSPTHSPRTPPPPVIRPPPTASNQLQPCSRFIKKNCRPVRP